MTIAVFMKESDDSLLIGADSQYTTGNIRSIKSKLGLVANQNIAWSFTGNRYIGWDKFRKWLNSYNFTGKTWETFVESAINQLSKLNGE